MLDRYYLEGSEIKFCSLQKDLGVLVDSSLRFHQHIRATVNKAAGIANNILSATLCRSPQFMVFILVTYVRPIIEFANPVWNTGYLEDLRLLERVQRAWTKKVAGLENLPYEDRLSALDLYSVQGRLLREDLILWYKIFHGLSTIAPTDLFVRDGRPGMRGHEFKVYRQRAQTDLRLRFFSLRCAEVWNSLPSAVVTAPSVAAFKRGLHTALGQRLFEFVP